MADVALLIEDEPDVRTALRILLERAGLETDEAAAGRDGLRRFHERRPDVVILDVGLPDLDGWGVLERIRDISDVPVLMLTARGLETEKVRGLAGADDYVTKPFSNAELVARIQALLRRSKTGADDAGSDLYVDGALLVDFSGRRVEVEGREIAVTPLEFRLLGTLVRHSGNVLSIEQLLEQAWNDPLGIGPERVKFAISRLRRKLGWDDPRGAPIESVRGFGYRYRADS